MGKDSKHQRTKGGVQPSNSGRTAELLHKTAGVGGSAGGASGSGAGGGSLPLSFLSAAAEAHIEFGVAPPPTTALSSLLLEDDLPPEIRMTFRKLQKKDAVTKIKALSELAQILGAPPPPNRDSSPSPRSRDPSQERPSMSPLELEELSKALLPHWIKAYQKLVLDDSRKVREVAQAPLTQLGKNVGRNLAPYLKQLMPYLVLAQNDLYSPVASAAKRAFHALFPTEVKRAEVLKYCKGEVIRLVLDNLQAVFLIQGSGKGDQGQGHKDKKGKGKKNKGQGQELPGTEDAGGGGGGGETEITTPSSTSTPGGGVDLSSNRGDGESYALRMTCASLQSLKSLIEGGLVDGDTLEVVFGDQGLFWGGNDLSKELLVRRNMYDILSSLTTYLASSTTLTLTELSTPFLLPPTRVTKFIQTALNCNQNQKETLPNLWKAFLLLTLNDVISDVSLARKQLLTCCKHGFYGNASQIGGSVPPLLNRIWGGLGSTGSEGDVVTCKQEFAHDILTSTILGYGVERSLFERASIARVLGEIVGFLTSQGQGQEGQPSSIELGPVYAFIYANLRTGDLSTAFAPLFGTLVQGQEYYDAFLEYGFSSPSLKEAINSKDFGVFLVNLCTPWDPTGGGGGGSTSGPHQSPGAFIKRRVQFREEVQEIPSTSTSGSNFSSLTPQKQGFLTSVVGRLVTSSSLKPLPILGRKFQDQKLWSGVNIPELLENSSSSSGEEDKLTRLQLYLELIQVFPELPTPLGKFSEEFENFSECCSDFKTFLKEIEPYIDLIPIRRWIRMPHFTGVLEKFLLTVVELEEGELLTILKFVFHRKSILSPEFTSGIISGLVERIGRDPSFSGHLCRILVSGAGSFSGDLSPIYKYYWESYFLKSVLASASSSSSSGIPGMDPEPNTELELIESVCFSNLGKLDSLEIVGILEKYLESCDKIRQIDTLLDINKRLRFPGEVLTPLPQIGIKVKSDFLSFLGFSYNTLELCGEGIPDPVPKFSKIHRSAISKAIFKAKLILSSDPSGTPVADCIVPLLNVIYAQALTRIWDEGEKSGYFDKLNRELASELDVVSSRLAEKIYEDPGAWKNCWEILLQHSSPSSAPDAIWSSRLPLRILSDYCGKAELGIPPFGSPTGTDTAQFAVQVTQVLEDFSKNSFKLSDVISWITEKRVKEPELFEFEVVFRHSKNPGLLAKLLSITTQLLARSDGGDEMSQEFLSLGTCWVAAWLKMSRNLGISSKMGLQWVAGLARTVRVISDRARDLGVGVNCPKFVQEYAEFHASQLYPVIYSLYVQLNEEIGGEGGLNNNFWTLQTLFYVSQALVTTPSNTLGYIEPDGVKLCEIFGNILGHGVSLPARIAAYRVLKKVRYDRTGEGDLPIVPPVIGAVIRVLVEKVYGWKEGDPEDLTPLISYLLIWDALLKIQQGSNEFATYVRDQDHLLTPFLNTLFFSERISLEDATAKNFEKELQLVPESSVNLLQLSCSVVQRTLRNLPYTVRWWWNNQVSRQRDRVFVEKFIVKHLSSKLAAEELGSVKLREGVDDNVTVHCHSGCNELIAHYRIEETNVTLTVSLPLNHPLGPVTVKISDKKLHGKINQLLNTRSHSLSAGLKLWKENLDGLYKDVDECAICFFILHNVTKQIPKLGCKTCKKKFHAACLYKWFSTSNKSECPLCRNLF